MRISRAWAAILLVSASCAAAQEGVAPQQGRMKDLLTRLARVEAKIPAGERYGPGQLAQARLAFRKIAGFPFSTTDPVAYINTGLDDAEKAVALLEKGQRAVALGTGFQERAYISATDGSPEPYLVYVPSAYDAKRAWPLLIFLHGYSSALDPANWVYGQYSQSLQDVCEREGYILLLPFGRRNTEFMGIGESDVLQTIEYVRKDYNVDPRRIIISGASMGGSGAYSIACHYPDRFAAVIGLCGRGDYYQWMNIRKEELPWFKQAQIDADYARELLPNLGHVPVLIFHGPQDIQIPIAQSRMLESRLKELGQAVQFYEITDAGHNDVWTPSFNHPAFRECLRSARLKEAPEKFTFRTMTLKHPGAYWARIESLQIWGRLAEVTASLAGGNSIDLLTQNVGQLVLLPSAAPAAVDMKQAKITLNGQRVVAAQRADGTLVLTPGPAPAAGGKTPLLCGPIREAYNGPFLIVYPADANVEGAKEDQANASRLLLEWFGCAVMQLPELRNDLPRALNNWAAFKVGPLPMRTDRNLTDAEIAGYNLILCGSPATNSVLARIADKLPVKIEKGEYSIGPHRYPVEGNGIEFIYPNPLAPGRYVMVVHGVPWGRQLSVNHKLDFQPDFIIFGKDTVEDKTLFPTNYVFCAGYFDQDWDFSPDSTWVNPVPEEGEAGDGIGMP